MLKNHFFVPFIVWTLSKCVKMWSMVRFVVLLLSSLSMMAFCFHKVLWCQFMIFKGIFMFILFHWICCISWQLCMFRFIFSFVVCSIHFCVNWRRNISFFFSLHFLCVHFCNLNVEDNIWLWLDFVIGNIKVDLKCFKLVTLSLSILKTNRKR